MLKLNTFHSFRARNIIVSNTLKPSHVNIATKKGKNIANVVPFMMSRSSNLGNNVRITTSLTQPIRFAHTDIKVPDWSEYRRNSVKSPKARTNDSEDQRKIGTYLVPLIGLTGAYYGTKCHAAHYIMFMDASADVLAAARSEVNIDQIPEGVSSTIKWRGKPVFITHRTQEDIKRERGVEVSKLRDPERDEDRVQRPEWLVVIGVCTHLGCIPIANMGDYNGYYCPCHGSHFDGSGRIRRGPAPTNLEVPQYTFADDKTIVIG